MDAAEVFHATKELTKEYFPRVKVESKRRRR
jgi:hypothetical protein